MSTRVVSIHYTLTDDTGAILDSSGNTPLQYLEGVGSIIPGLEQAVASLSTGDKKKITVEAKDAYGEPREDLILQVAKSQFPSDISLKVGDRFRSGGESHSPVFTVIEVLEDAVKLDGNHPLAGKSLHFDVEVTEIRPATEEEIAHGHVHGEHGHHH